MIVYLEEIIFELIVFIRIFIFVVLIFFLFIDWYVISNLVILYLVWWNNGMLIDLDVEIFYVFLVGDFFCLNIFLIE